MENAEMFTKIKSDNSEREKFIRDNFAFIIKCASVCTGYYVDEGDDIFSEALISFNSAIDRYDSGKGHFHAFAKVCISNSLKDYFRQQKKHSKSIPFSALSTQDDDADEIAFDIPDSSAFSGAGVEIFSLTQELKYFNISLSDLPKASPKASKTRKSCIEVAGFIVKNPELSKYVYQKKMLPIKELYEQLRANKKVLERHRKYIIAVVLILGGHYETLPEYVNIKEV